jgi:hypothetical protein
VCDVIIAHVSRYHYYYFLEKFLFFSILCFYKIVYVKFMADSEHDVPVPPFGGGAGPTREPSSGDGTLNDSDSCRMTTGQRDAIVGKWITNAD